MEEFSIRDFAVLCHCLKWTFDDAMLGWSCLPYFQVLVAILSGLGCHAFGRGPSLGELSSWSRRLP